MRISYQDLITKISNSLPKDMKVDIEKMPLLIKYSGGSEYRGSLERAYGEDLKRDALNPHDNISKIELGKTCDGELQIVLHVVQNNFVALVQTQEIILLRIDYSKQHDGKDYTIKPEYYVNLIGGKQWTWTYYERIQGDIWFLAMVKRSLKI